MANHRQEVKTIMAFESLEKAIKAGYEWYDWDNTNQLHIVRHPNYKNTKTNKEAALAFAKNQ